MKNILFLAAMMGLACCESHAQSIRQPVHTYNAGAVVYSSAAIASDGTLYFGTEGTDSGSIVALHPDLSPYWKYTTSEWVDSSVLIGPRGYLFAATWDGNLLALKPEGGLHWSMNLGGLFLASPAMSADGTLYLATTDGVLFAINPYSNPTTGTIKWTFIIDGEFTSSPAISPSGQVIIGAKLNSDDGIMAGVYAIHPTTGSQLWEYLDEPAIVGDTSRILSSPAIDASGNIYVGIGRTLLESGSAIASGALLSLTGNGIVRWEITTNDKVDCSPILGPNNNLYFATRLGTLYAYSTAGQLQWSIDVGDVFYSNPTIAADGTLYAVGYVGSGISRLSAIKDNRTSAQALWTADITGYVDSSPTLADNGMLYVGTYGGQILAYDTGNQPGTTYWPKFRRDLKGRSNPAFATTRTADDYFAESTIFGSGWLYWPVGVAGLWLHGNSYPWVYSYENGWWYCHGNGGQTLWLYDTYAPLSWLFTNNTYYPLFWSVSPDVGWLFYLEGSKAPRNFYTLQNTLITAP